jgi:hypothetical protein
MQRLLFTLVMVMVMVTAACGPKLDGEWYGRHESALELDYTETLRLESRGHFTRTLQYTDNLGCARTEIYGGTYEFVGPMKLRFFIREGRQVRRCGPRMDMNRPDMKEEDFDRTIAAATVDCQGTERGPDTLMLECGTSGWTNRCYARSMPEVDCTPPNVE